MSKEEKPQEGDKHERKDNLDKTHPFWLLMQGLLAIIPQVIKIVEEKKKHKAKEEKEGVEPER